MTMRTRTADNLHRILEEEKKVLVSYSGGVDSTFLAAVAREVLGGGSLCVILDSPLLPRPSLKRALDRAEKLGIEVEVISLPILGDPRFVENPE